MHILSPVSCCLLPLGLASSAAPYSRIPPACFPLLNQKFCLPCELHILYDPLFRDAYDRAKPLYDSHVGTSNTESRSKYGNSSTGYTVRGSNPGRGRRFFCPTKRPVRLWDPPSLLLSVYWGKCGMEKDHFTFCFKCMSSGLQSFFSPSEGSFPLCTGSV